jgi:CxxC-x17-CxxC domain-containing protein
MFFEDKVLTCKQCSCRFVFSVSEQEFFSKKEFTDPVRCPECRAARRINEAQREMFPAVCTTCGKETTVPFQPADDRPVFCRNCFKPAGWGDRSNQQALANLEVEKENGNQERDYHNKCNAGIL